MRDMPPMTLAEIETAPFRVEQRARLRGSPEAVWKNLAEPARWLDWFPMMHRATWTSDKTAAVGAERSVALRVFGKFDERILAWDPGERFAFTMIASTSPLAKRMAEDWRITRHGPEVELEWVVGAFPTTVGRPATPILRAVLRQMFARGTARLRRLLDERGTQVA
ncbi:MAG: SRPBCC family protein [Deltaproteobacteria bacterium]|nr:SRPBCC family protein [Deltaproteobacteria bacterium]MDQ3296597.1 SRPBCC family protein [Myxococcota bacterium]